jgi:small basic protein (TIGR04137 family)
MSIDRSLKIKGALSRHRNVLTRAERVEKLKDEERWSEEQSVFGLPKVIHRKSHAGRKIKEAPEKAAEGAIAAVPGTAGATPAAKTPEPEAKTKKA